MVIVAFCIANKLASNMFVFDLHYTSLYLLGQRVSMDSFYINDSAVRKMDVFRHCDPNGVNSNARENVYGETSSQGKDDGCYVGFAFDYGKYPKILAVHSGVEQSKQPSEEAPPRLYDSPFPANTRMERSEEFSRYPPGFYHMQMENGFRVNQRFNTRSRMPMLRLNQSHIARGQMPPHFLPVPDHNLLLRPNIDPRARLNDNYPRMAVQLQTLTRLPKNLGSSDHQKRHFDQAGGLDMALGPANKSMRFSYQPVEPTSLESSHFNKQADYPGTVLYNLRPMQYPSYTQRAFMPPVIPWVAHPGHGPTLFNADNALSCSNIVGAAVNSAREYATKNPRSCKSKASRNAYVRAAIQEKVRMKDKSEVQAPSEKGDSFSHLLLHENRHDLLQTLKSAASSSRDCLLSVVKKLLLHKAIESALLLLDCLKRSDLTEKVKERVLSVVQEIIWGYPPKQELWTGGMVGKEKTVSSTGSPKRFNFTEGPTHSDNGPSKNKDQEIIIEEICKRSKPDVYLSPRCTENEMLLESSCLTASIQELEEGDAILSPRSTLERFKFQEKSVESSSLTAALHEMSTEKDLILRSEIKHCELNGRCSARIPITVNPESATTESITSEDINDLTDSDNYDTTKSDNCKKVRGLDGDNRCKNWECADSKDERKGMDHDECRLMDRIGSQKETDRTNEDAENSQDADEYIEEAVLQEGDAPQKPLNCFDGSLEDEDEDNFVEAFQSYCYSINERSCIGEAELKSLGKVSIRVDAKGNITIDKEITDEEEKENETSRLGRNKEESLVGSEDNLKCRIATN